MRMLFPIAAVIVVLAGTPSFAEEQQPIPPGESPADVARRAADRLVNALRGLIGSIPQYAMPEVLPNGDILIRRKPPEPAAPAEPSAPVPAEKPTRT